MKKGWKRVPELLLCLALLFCLAACGGGTAAEDIWQNALYTEDTRLGEGSTEFTLTVTAGEKSVNFTVCTDQTVLGDALLEQGLIAGEEGPYGLYVKEVNGIRADYDQDKAYWAFLIGEETAMTGVDGAEIAPGEVYQLVYTRG